MRGCNANMENCFGKDGACECNLERGSEKDETLQNEIRPEYGTHQTPPILQLSTNSKPFLSL